MNKISKPSKKQLPALLKALVLVVLATGCWTTRPAEPPQPCFCGLVKKDQNEATCAVWYKNWDKPERQPVAAHKTNATCTLQDCEELFKGEGQCSELQMWPTAAPMTPASTDPCFCDFVRVQNHPSGSIACAIWKPGDRMLKEYHFTEKCDPEVCSQEPFLEGQSYCQNNFQKFYQ